MSNKTDIKGAITSVLNGLFESIEAEDNEKSAILTDRLCELFVNLMLDALKYYPKSP